jgi:16S rRNA (cytosine1402-N4)-methyltransferase
VIRAAYHIPVLPRETLQFLLTDPAGTYLDATTGGGGHAAALAGRLAPGGRLVCLDADDEALRNAGELLAGGPVTLRRANFRDLRRELEELGISRITGALFDLGVSSRQLDDATRGFSFRADEPLDMRMDRRSGLTARDVVNTYDERRLADILFTFGEERNSRRIARSIVRLRPVDSTGALRTAVAAATGGGPFLVKSLARVFQALRIEVNGELDALAAGLRDATALLVPGGRIVVIAYHSLEDRMVKAWFRSEARAVPLGPPPVTAMSVPRLRILTARPVVPGAEEEEENPRSRSAKLRAAERLPEERP